MTVYTVSYDLHRQRDYHPIWASLQALSAKRLLESLWLVNSNSTAIQLRDHLQQSLDGDDSIVVIQVPAGSLWATTRAQPDGVQMLRQHVLA
jgi:hypothetical protein